MFRHTNDYSSKTFGALSSGVVSGKITEFRVKTMPTYNPHTSYSNSFNTDWGMHSRTRKIYSENKYKPYRVPSEKPHNPILTDKFLLQSAQKIALDAVNTRSLFPREINKPLVFSGNMFEGLASPYQANSKLVARTSSKNMNWLQNREKEVIANKMQRGEYIPSLKHLDLYGKRKEFSKFERYGLWIMKNPSN